jgi:hypothetical protein
LPLGGFKIADDDREQIIEIMRDAAGKVADRVELLRLPQRLFGHRAPVDFCVQARCPPQHRQQRKKQDERHRDAVD